MTDSDGERTACKRSRTYNKICDAQRIKLEQFYDDGMKSCSNNQGEILSMFFIDPLTMLTVKDLMLE